MASRKTAAPQRKQALREYSQLLRMQERLLSQFQRIRDELVAPVTTGLMRDIRNRTGTAPTTAMIDLVGKVEEGIRALKLLESEIQTSMLEEPGEEFTVEG